MSLFWLYELSFDRLDDIEGQETSCASSSLELSVGLVASTCRYPGCIRNCASVDTVGSLGHIAGDLGLRDSRRDML